MKRDKRLYPLSWDHHELLLYADRVRMALVNEHPAYRESLEEILRKSMNFWEGVMKGHLKAEKEILFPALTQCDDGFRESLALLSRNFEALQTLYSEITAEPGRPDLKDQLIRFSELITHHVRYEERELFPKVQITLPDAQFNRVGSDLQARLPRACRQR